MTEQTRNLGSRLEHGDTPTKGDETWTYPTRNELDRTPSVFSVQVSGQGGLNAPSCGYGRLPHSPRPSRPRRQGRRRREGWGADGAARRQNVRSIG